MAHREASREQARRGSRHMISDPKEPIINIDSFWMPRQGSTIAKEIDLAFYGVYWLDVVMFIGVVSALFYFAYRFKRRTEKDKVSKVTHNLTLEITWTIIPTVIVIGLFGLGLRGYLNASVAPAEAYEIRVIAQTWAWTFVYPDGRVTTGGLEGEGLVVPKGRPVKLIMSSQDVVHSFWVPEFRVKQDLVPGTYTTIWFEPTEVTDTALQCTEYCGKDHSNMYATVHVLEESKFKEWVEKGGMDDKLTPAEQGKKLFAQRTCNTCHSVDGTRIQGPSFKGLWGKTEAISDGSSVKVDENYIRESLLEPQKKVVQGYPAVMPTFKGTLKEKEIDALIAYIKTVQ
jgi:cytochrome c oxidase subunit 2